MKWTRPAQRPCREHGITSGRTDKVAEFINPFTLLAPGRARRTG
ncbi:hypothetical protein ACWGH2_27545 [Streptomyces sp. NPDC054871]